jgi:tRNA dimethylallyltransferase
VQPVSGAAIILKREQLGKPSRDGKPRPDKPNPVVVIGGPTASGKSDLALRMAERFAGTVINGDAMQVYRELKVLTARPSDADLARAPHRLYGVLSARERCTAAQWRTMALEAIGDARRDGRLAIVVGGTGLYLRALMEGLAPVPEVPADIREGAVARHRALGGAAFHAELAGLDPEMAARLKPGDTQRLIRAWEVVTATGRSLASFQRLPIAESGLRFAAIRLLPPRDALYAACDARCLRMVEEGALDEVRALLALGLDPSLPAMKSLGVRELAAYIRGEADREDAIARFQQTTRNYAKRQVTWFRHQMSDAFTVDAQFSESLAEKIFSFIRKTVDPSRPAD